MKNGNRRTVRALPDAEVCWIELHPALKDYAHCRTSRPHECPYVLPFGLGFLCRHPERENFLSPPARRQRART